MIELLDDDMGERGKAGLAACNGLRRRRRLDDLVAGAAAILGPHGSNDAPLDRGDGELLVAILPERAQRAAAIGTGAVAGLGLDPSFGARQMIGQRAHRRGSVGGRPRASPRTGRRSCGEAERAGGGGYRSAYRGPPKRLRARRSGRPCRCWMRLVPTPGTPSKTGIARPVKPTIIRHFLPCEQGRRGAFGTPPVDAFE